MRRTKGTKGTNGKGPRAGERKEGDWGIRAANEAKEFARMLQWRRLGRGHILENTVCCYRLTVYVFSPLAVFVRMVLGRCSINFQRSDFGDKMNGRGKLT